MRPDFEKESPYIIVDEHESDIPRSQTYEMDVLGYSFPSSQPLGNLQEPNLNSIQIPKPENKLVRGMFVRIKTGQSGVKLVGKMNNVEVSMMKKNEKVGTKITKFVDKVIPDQTYGNLHDELVNSEDIPFIASICEVPMVQEDTIASDHSYVSLKCSTSTSESSKTPSHRAKSKTRNSNNLDIKLNGSTRKYPSTTTRTIGVETDENLLNIFIEEKIKQLNKRKKSVSIGIQVDDNLVTASEFASILESIQHDHQTIQCEMESKAKLHFKLQLLKDLKNCDTHDEFGNLPLHSAVLDNNVKLVVRYGSAMKIRGLNINSINHSFQTSLQLAVISKASIEIFQILIRQYDADTEVCDSNGNNLLHLAILYSDSEMVEMLVPLVDPSVTNSANFDGYTPLILSTIEGAVDKVEVLLRAGVDPNIADKKSGRTALFHAVEKNDYALVNLLMDYKALTKIKNFFGTSPHDAMFELDAVDVNIRRMILHNKRIIKRRTSSKRVQNSSRYLLECDSFLKRVKLTPALEKHE